MPRLLVFTLRTSEGPAGVTLHDGNSGLRVTKVFPGDQAERAGLRCNDVIVRMNGIPCVKSVHGASLLTTAADHGLDVRCEARRRW